MTELFLDASDYFALLDHEQRAEADRWLEHVAPERSAMSAEMVSEGRIRLLTIPKDLTKPLGVYRVDEHGHSVLPVAIYTTEPPPPCFLRAMCYR